MTSHNKDVIRDELLMLERRILDPESIKNFSIINNILAESFLEFGSSGKIYNKQGVIEALSNSISADINITDFDIHFLADDLFLVTYKAVRDLNNGKSCSLRSSIWKYLDNRWQIIFHQGTIIP